MVNTCQCRRTKPAHNPGIRPFFRKKYAELKPLLLELHQEPAPHLEVLFLTGMLAAEEGDFAKAADEFRAMLARDPSLIRPRLELASALQKWRQASRQVSL